MTDTMRLLVVEDEQRLAAGRRKGLEAEGFAVDVVHNGTDGIWMARENPFDAIILDVMQPGANGYRVCRKLRNGIGVHSSDRCHCVTSWPKLGGRVEWIISSLIPSESCNRNFSGWMSPVGVRRLS